MSFAKLSNLLATLELTAVNEPVILVAVKLLIKSALPPKEPDIAIDTGTVSVNRACNILTSFILDRAIH